MKAQILQLALGLVLISAAAQAQAPTAPGTTAPNAAPAAPASPADQVQQAQSGTVLTLRGLEKITGRPTNIVAPIGKAVNFATLTITARYCYSTPPSETPETAAFVQISDHRADQSEKQVFSGWMYASSPGLNGMEHPLYDVWVIGCNNSAAGSPTVSSSTAPVKVGSPDSSDKEEQEALPADAGK